MTTESATVLTVLFSVCSFVEIFVRLTHKYNVTASRFAFSDFSRHITFIFLEGYRLLECVVARHF